MPESELCNACKKAPRVAGDVLCATCATRRDAWVEAQKALAAETPKSSSTTVASTPAFQRPSPGRIVLFGWTGGSQGVRELPGIVTHVYEDGERVDLAVQGAGRYLEAHAVRYAEKGGPNLWRWPPRT